MLLSFIFNSAIGDACSATTYCSAVSDSVCETTCKTGLLSYVVLPSKWYQSQERWGTDLVLIVCI